MQAVFRNPPPKNWEYARNGWRNAAYNTAATVSVTHGCLVITTYTDGGTNFTGFIDTKNRVMKRYSSFAPVIHCWVIWTGYRQTGGSFAPSGIRFPGPKASQFANTGGAKLLVTNRPVPSQLVAVSVTPFRIT